MPDTNGDPVNNQMYTHWNLVKVDATTRMDLVHTLQNESGDYSADVKAAKLVAVKAGSGHNPSSCATCQAYAGLPPVAE